MKEVKEVFAGLLMVSCVAGIIALLSLLVVNFTGFPSCIDGTVVRTTDGGLRWLDMSGVEPFDPSIKDLPIVIGRAQIFLGMAWAIAMMAIPIVFLVVDRWVYPITWTSQMRVLERERILERKTARLIRSIRSGDQFEADGYYLPNVENN